ncbi:MAG: YbaB/EbfC family nucleoid-associated protein [bacterium]
MRIDMILKQAQKIQNKMEEIQKKLAGMKFEGSSGGEMVKATVDGQQNLLEVKIDPEVLDADDVQMLEDLIVAAVNEARRKAQETATEEMKAVTGGMAMPGMFGTTK